MQASERNIVACGQQRQVVTDSVCREGHHHRLPTSLHICRHLQVLRMYLNIYCHRQVDGCVTISFPVSSHTQNASSLASPPITMAMMRAISGPRDSAAHAEMALAVVPCNGCCHGCWQKGTCSSRGSTLNFQPQGQVLAEQHPGAQQCHTDCAPLRDPLPQSERPGLCSETCTHRGTTHHTSTLVEVCSHSTPVTRRTALPDFNLCEAKTMAASPFTLFSAWVHMLQISMSAGRKQTSTFQLGRSGHPAPCGA